MAHNCPGNLTVIKAGKLLRGCPDCIRDKVQPNELAASHRREYQRREYARDLVQPFEKDYVKARGIDAAREAGWDDDSIRKHL